MCVCACVAHIWHGHFTPRTSGRFRFPCIHFTPFLVFVVRASTSVMPLHPPGRTFRTRLLPFLNLYDHMASALSSSASQHRRKCSAIVRFCGHSGLFSSCEPFFATCFCCFSLCSSYCYIRVCLPFKLANESDADSSTRVWKRFENHKSSCKQKCFPGGLHTYCTCTFTRSRAYWHHMHVSCVVEFLL